MKREDLLRRLEERLARGEISEETYKEIKARYDCMPEEVEEEGASKAGALDLSAVIEESISAAMEQVGRRLEGAFESGDFDERMEEVGEKVREALGRIGPRFEEGGRRVVISGSGVVTSDSPLDEFRCAGSGKVTSDLRAREVSISGACKVDGSCDSDEFHASGSVKVAGGMKVGEFHSSGSVAIGSDLQGKEIKSSGSLVVGGSVLNSGEVRVSGKMEVEGSVKAQEFHSTGRFRIGESLEAQEIEIRVGGTSKVPLIKGQEITVRSGRDGGDLVVGTVEGEEIHLESTRADVVRGKTVRIGPFCTIGVVEAEEMEVHETSTVKEQRQPSPE